MARAIDADRLLQVLETNFGHTGGADVMRQLIEAQPTLTPPNEWVSGGGEVAGIQSGNRGKVVLGGEKRQRRKLANENSSIL